MYSEYKEIIVGTAIFIMLFAVGLTILAIPSFATTIMHRDGVFEKGQLVEREDFVSKTPGVVITLS